MTVVAVCAAHGGAGATTTALALAASWPAGDPVLLAELDQSGADIAAWHDLARTPAVSSAVVGVRSPSVDELLRHTQELPGGGRVLVGPTGAVEATAAVNEAARILLPALRAQPDLVVVADCGRITAAVSSPVPALATTTVVVVRQDPLSAPRTVGLVEHARELTETLSRITPVVVALVGSAPYPPREIEAHIGAELVGVLDHDDLAAARLAGRQGNARALERSRLMRSGRAMATALKTRLGALVTPAPDAPEVSAPPVPAFGDELDLGDEPPHVNGHRPPLEPRRAPEGRR